MKWKDEYLYLLIFAMCFAGFQYLEEVVRINYDRKNALINYFLGIIPNFLPAIGLPSLFVVLIKELTGKSTNKILLKQKNFVLAIGISQVGLIGWEFQQIIAPYGTFDWNDILWTILGGVLFLMIWKSKPLNTVIE